MQSTLKFVAAIAGLCLGALVLAAPAGGRVEEWRGGVQGGRRHAPGYQRAELSGIEIQSGQATDHVVFSLSRGLRLAGHVVDAATGAGIPDVDVSYRPADDPRTRIERLRFPHDRVTTDERGAFVFDGLPAETITITARSPLYADAERTVTPGDEDSIEIRLGRGAAVSGRVVGPDGHTPVPESRVSLSDAGHWSAVTIAADEAGAFAFRHLRAGRYGISAEAGLGAVRRREVLLKENAPGHPVRSDHSRPHFWARAR